MYRHNYNSVTISKYFLRKWQIPSRAEGWPAQPLFEENCTGHIHKNKKCFFKAKPQNTAILCTYILEHLPSSPIWSSSWAKHSVSVRHFQFYVGECCWTSFLPSFCDSLIAKVDEYKMASRLQWLPIIMFITIILWFYYTN